MQGDGGPITIPPDSRVSIERDGTISTVPQNGAQNVVTVVGRLKLVNPPETDLVRGPDGYFRMGGGNEAEQDDTVKIASGYIENSNVNPVEQMVAMISLCAPVRDADAHDYDGRSQRPRRHADTCAPIIKG